MKFLPRALLFATLLLARLESAAASEAKQEFERPPFAGAYEPQGIDERGLWMELDESERQFQDSPLLVRDEELRDYLRSVLCKTVGFDRCEATRLYIVRDRTFNASMAPNGLMLVHTGLLARVHSEAELATVLAHEFAHFELRHSLNRFRKIRTGTDIMAWLSLGGAATNTNMRNSLDAIAASFYQFSREQEQEADLLAAAYVRSSPYPLRASQVWKRLLDENDELRKERNLRRIKRYRPGVTDTHPTNLQRIAYFLTLETETGAQDGEDGAIYYQGQTVRVMPELLDSLVKGNEFAAADFVIRSRGDVLGWDGLMLYERGELYRLRGNPRDLVTAREFFRKATEYPDSPAECWRGLGLASIRLGDSVTGKAALAEYLVRVPGAKDAATIRFLMEN